MSCERFKDKVGYRGQSHAVIATWPNGEIKTLGWQNGTDLKSWQALAKAWRLKDLKAVEVKEYDKEKQ